MTVWAVVDHDFQVFPELTRFSSKSFPYNDLCPFPLLTFRWEESTLLPFTIVLGIGKHRRNSPSEAPHEPRQ
jgi:hypothetical protein